MDELSDRIRVLDFGQAISAPVACSMLGELGADVIKIEPVEGDFTRLTAREGDSTVFMTCNHSQRSLAVNLKEPKGYNVVLQLVKSADVLVHNFRPGVMERLGLGYEDMSKSNPRLIYCAMPMYGETGPIAHRRGGEPSAQAMTGLVASGGEPGKAPIMVTHAIIDSSTGLTATFGIAWALYMRERTGVGQKVSTNLLNVGTYLQATSITDYLLEGR